MKQRDLLWKNSLVTLRETLGGFALAVSTGTFLGVMTVYFPLFRKMVYPLIVASQAVPETAIAPLFLIWLGFGILPKIAIAFLVALFPIVVNSVVGLTSLDPDMVRLARSMGTPGLKFFLKIQLPNALPTMLAGMKISTTLAIVGAIVGEFVGAGAGLGYVMVLTISTVNTPLLFAGLVCTAIMGMMLFLSVQFVESYLIPWHVSKRPLP
jgi:NitT/TauT family transport system permease protein